MMNPSCHRYWENPRERSTPVLRRFLSNYSNVRFQARLIRTNVKSFVYKSDTGGRRTVSRSSTCVNGEYYERKVTVLSNVEIDVQFLGVYERALRCRISFGQETRVFL